MNYKFYLKSDQYVRGQYTFNIEAKTTEEAQKKVMSIIDNNEAPDDFGYLYSCPENEGWGKNIEVIHEGDYFIYLPEIKEQVNLDHYEEFKKDFIEKHGNIISEQIDEEKGIVNITTRRIYKPFEPLKPEPERVFLFNETNGIPEDHRIIGVVDENKLKEILPKKAKGVRIGENCLLAIS